MRPPYGLNLELQSFPRSIKPKSITMEQITINSVEEIKSFFQMLYDKHDLAFHPDDPFDDYVNIETKNKVFSKEDSVVLDQAMEDCFTYCEENDLDIYDICGEVQRAEFIKRGIIDEDDWVI